MNDENPTADKSDTPSDSGPEIQGAETVNSPNATPPQADSEFQDVKRELTGYERSTLRLTWVIVVVNVLTCIFIGLQFYEMKSDSTDTHSLAVAAGQQATAANTQSQQAIAQTNKMAESLSKTDDLIAATTDLASQAKRQANAALDSNRINRESLESVQRAFVAYHSIECNRGKSGDRIYWSIQPVWENGGNTPAFNVVNNYTITEGRVEIPEEVFKVGKMRIAEKLTVSSIAPKALQPTTPASLDESYLFGINLGDKFENFIKSVPRGDLSIFGWIVYNDAMPKTAAHLTEFCRHFDPPGLIDENPAKMKFNFANCPQHNCTDEYCPDYVEIVKYAESRRPN